MDRLLYQRLFPKRLPTVHLSLDFDRLQGRRLGEPFIGDRAIGEEKRRRQI